MQDDARLILGCAPGAPRQMFPGTIRLFPLPRCTLRAACRAVWRLEDLLRTPRGP